MGAGSSQPAEQGPKTPEQAEEKLKQTDKVTKNIEAAIQLVKEYNIGNVEVLYNHIQNDFKEDIDGLGPQTKEKLENYIKSLKLAEEEGRPFIDALQQKKVQLFFEGKNSKNFKDQLEELKGQVDPNVFKEANLFADALAKLTSREQYYKYYYLLTQLWIIVYVKRMSHAIVDFTSTIVNFYNIAEEERNRSTKDLLAKLMKLLKMETGDLSEEDFNFFRTSMKTFEDSITKSSENLKEKMGDAKNKLEQTLQKQFPEMKKAVNAQAQMSSQGESGQQGQPSRYGGKRGALKGGFVRDGSRFPEAFFAEPTKTFDQFGGQSFDELNIS